ncbi:MAG: hypothetical protein V2I43_22670, partial [Parvularcula sp.]|nr:hypothetical protein [Parvularcula sp.]
MTRDPSSRAAKLAALRAELSLTDMRKAEPCMTLGLGAVDEHLPWGGLPAGLHETAPFGADLPHEAAATQLMAWLLARA